MGLEMGGVDHQRIGLAALGQGLKKADRAHQGWQNSNLHAVTDAGRPLRVFLTAGQRSD